MSLLNTRFSDKYYDSWEIISPEKRSFIVREKLCEYIDYAVREVSYYKKISGGFEAHSEYPLKSFPVMTSKRLRELLPPVSDTLMIKNSGSSVSVFQSGGTTGIPKTTLFSHEEMELLNLPNARGFFALGLDKSDRVANLFAVGGLYMTFVHINRMLQQYGCLSFPFSNQTPYDFVHSVIKLFNINVITGITSVVLSLMRRMYELGLDGIKIEKVFYGGEHIYGSDRRELEQKFNVRLIAAPGYGTVDTWYIGYQCLECPPGIFHTHDDQCYIEIVNDETGEHCREQEIGMLYATPFVRRLTPIIRYQVGDRAMWIGKQCKCGRTTPLFRLLGRGDDILRIGYDSVDYEYIQALVAENVKSLGAVQMEKKREDGKDRLVIRIETNSDSSEYPEISALLSQKILEGRPTLRGFIEKGTVLPLEIEVLKIGAIERSSRTGKLKKVVDSEIK